VFLVDLKGIKGSSNKNMEWIKKMMRLRGIGATQPREGSEFMPMTLVDGFDYLIFIKHTSAASTLPDYDKTWPD